MIDFSNAVILMMKRMKKVKFAKLSSTTKDNTKGVPLVVSYHPGLKNINQIINQNLHLFIWIKRLRKSLHQKPSVSTAAPGS